MFGSKAIPALHLDSDAHPFFPVTIELVGYVANDKNALELLTIFLGGWVVILGATWATVTRYSPQTNKLDKTIILWFILSGLIHLLFEGYFSLNHATMAPSMNLFGQLWKEYAYSDSRYLTSDPFVLTMETVTAFAWGPLSLITAYFIASHNSLRYPIQAIVSLGQIYGDVLYYATAMFDYYYKNLHYCRPESYYFWFYFFFMNFIWIVIPGFLLYQSVSETSKAFKALDRMSKSLQGNGSAKSPQKKGNNKKHA